MTRRRGHPFVFMLVFGTAVVLFAHGQVGYGVLMLAWAWILVVR